MTISTDMVWQNPDQERTNHNARIYLKTALPYNKTLLHDRTGQKYGRKRSSKVAGLNDPGFD